MKGIEPGCHYRHPGRHSQRFDTCNYDSGWTIELGGEHDRERRVLYGSVRADATEVVAIEGNGNRTSAELSKPVDEQPWRFFVVEGVPGSVERLEATVPGSPTIRAERSPVQRSHLEPPPRWEVADPTMGWVHQFRAGCPG